MELLKKINIDINSGTNTTIKAKQGDTARGLLISITNNGSPFSLQDKKVKIYALKPDGKKVYNSCIITDASKGEVKFKFTSQTLSTPGLLELELVITEGEDILSTVLFNVEVISKLRDNDSILSKDEYDILLSTIDKGQTLEVSIKELIGEGNPLYNKLKLVVDEGKQLNIDLPPKVTSAENIYNLLDAAIRNGQLDSFMKKTYLDTRNTNENPEWYFENYPSQTITEFKLISSLGISTAAYFGILETKVPWDGNSGGYPVQTFVSYSLLAIYKRHGISNTEWSTWEKVYTSGDKPTPDEIGAVRRADRTPLWDAGAGGWVLSWGHKAKLSKSIADTPNGLILEWSAYTGGVIRDYNFCYTPVHKCARYDRSIVVDMTNTAGKKIYKVVYIKDNGMAILGKDENESGDNSSMVLRRILEC